MVHKIKENKIEGWLRIIASDVKFDAEEQKAILKGASPEEIRSKIMKGD